MLPKFVWKENAFAAGTSPVERLLARRGITDAEVFFSAPLRAISHPHKLPCTKEAAEIIARTIERGGEIVIFGDFDCDGVTATALLATVLRSHGAVVRTFIPRRATEGYGLSEGAVTRCLEGGVPALLITVDCGEGAGEQLQRFIARGTKVIVSDHHTPAAAPLPEGIIKVSPHNAGTPPALSALCGAGVAFEIAFALELLLNPDAKDHRECVRWLDALAVATVADIMPLVGDNRIFVAAGLRRLRTSPHHGLYQLLRTTELRDDAELSAYHLGYILGPHINAAGRMGDAQAALELLLAADNATAAAKARILHALNEERRAGEARLLRKAQEQVKADAAAVVVAGEDWHAGLIGLLAGKLCDSLRRPVAAISLATRRASARAPEGYNIFAALTECAEFLENFGGHAAAAGFTLKEGALEAFRARFEKVCFEQVGGKTMTPSLMLEEFIAPEDASLDFAESIEKFAPFGEGNPCPIWGVRAAEATDIRAIGKSSLHLRFSVSHGGKTFPAIWFNAARFEKELSGKIDFAGHFEVNRFRGKSELQFRVLDARSAE